MTTKVIVGAMFGDEGKGLTTSCLAQKNDLVIRFNGGAQAGHTVEKEGYRHVFSSFGSGTLNDAHTYWSEYCALYPKSYFNEYHKLTEQGYRPICYIHPLAPVITPFDIDHNRGQEKINNHGSVGMGFGSTIYRHMNTPHKLYAFELAYPELLYHKLSNIAIFYNASTSHFLKDVEDFTSYVSRIDWKFAQLSEIKHNYNNIVFEGAQGIMLDMDLGFFPNVTYSNTTSKNALQIIKENNLPLPEIYYVMRSYLTRHGNGYMPNESSSVCFEDKTNVTHEYQGQFRQGFHSLDLIKHALNCDNVYSNGCNKNLVITCLNQTDDKILIDCDYKNISTLSDLGLKNHTSDSPTEIKFLTCKI